MMKLGIFSCALIQASARSQGRRKCSYQELQEYFDQNEIGNVDVDYKFTKKQKPNGRWTPKFAIVNSKTMKNYPRYKFMALKGMCKDPSESFSFTCRNGKIKLNRPCLDLELKWDMTSCPKSIPKEKCWNKNTQQFTKDSLCDGMPSTKIQIYCPVVEWEWDMTSCPSPPQQKCLNKDNDTYIEDFFCSNEYKKEAMVCPKWKPVYGECVPTENEGYCGDGYLQIKWLSGPADNEDFTYDTKNDTKAKRKCNLPCKWKPVYGECVPHDKTRNCGGGYYEINGWAGPAHGWGFKYDSKDNTQAKKSCKMPCQDELALCSYQDLKNYFDENVIGDVDVDYKFTSEKQVQGKYVDYVSIVEEVTNENMINNPDIKFIGLAGRCIEIHRGFVFECTNGNIKLNKDCPPLKNDQDEGQLKDTKFEKRYCDFISFQKKFENLNRWTKDVLKGFMWDVELPDSVVEKYDEKMQKGESITLKEIANHWQQTFKCENGKEIPMELLKRVSKFWMKQNRRYQNKGEITKKLWADFKSDSSMFGR